MAKEKEKYYFRYVPLTSGPSTVLQKNYEKAIYREEYVESEINVETDKSGEINFNQLYDPLTCPPQYLPYLAYANGVIVYDPAWPIERKRAYIYEYPALKAYAGSGWSLKRAFELLDLSVFILSSDIPYQFKVVVDEDDFTESELDAVLRLVDSLKSKRDHYNASRGKNIDFKMGIGMIPRITKILRYGNERRGMAQSIYITEVGRQAMILGDEAGYEWLYSSVKIFDKYYQPKETDILQEGSVVAEYPIVDSMRIGTTIHIALEISDSEEFEIGSVGLWGRSDVEGSEEVLFAVVSDPEGYMSIKKKGEDYIVALNVVHESLPIDSVVVGTGARLNLNLEKELAEVTSKYMDLLSENTEIRNRLLALEAKVG